MLSIEQIKARVESTVPSACVEVVRNPSPAGQDSLIVAPSCGLAVALFLRDDPDLRLDYLSNVSGVDRPDTVLKETVRSKQVINGLERDIEETIETRRPGFLEAVYHLYSTALNHGPLVLRMRTPDRGDGARLPSLTPVWRGAEFQEREIFDLYGIAFDGHPDLRRILMWEGFTDFPMRKDYIEPDDYEYEPTAHGRVKERASANQRATDSSGSK